MRRVLLIFFGCILILAASLKLEMVASWQTSPGTHSLFIIPESIIEWVLGTWLLTGIAMVWARRALFVVLAIFIVVNILFVFEGSSDCGCFGNIHVHPALTLLLDVIVLVGICLPGRIRQGDPAEDIPFRRLFGSSIASIAIPLIVFLPAVMSTGPARGEPVIFNSKQWIGKPFPLFKYLNASSRADLSRGRKTVIVFNDQCAECRAFISRLASGNDISIPDTDVRLIDLAQLHSGGNSDFLLTIRFPVVSLESDAEYIGPIPLEVSLSNGAVIGANRPK